MKKVLITGVTGMDGSNMIDYLYEKFGEKICIFGMVRRTSALNPPNLAHLKINHGLPTIISGDLTDQNSINHIVRSFQPDYFINFAAQSFVGESWNTPLNTFNVDALGVLNCLEAIRNYAPLCRFYSAGSSEEFGDVQYSPQDINHPVRPRSPYGAAKAAARHLVKVYRDSYRLYAIHGILFNHEGFRRGQEFVTRKITKGVARIVHETLVKDNLDFEPLYLGNIDTRRDWSDSEDFVDGIWRMLNQEEYRKDFPSIDCGNRIPYLKEYVLSSGETHTVREFVEKAFRAVGINGVWWRFDENDPKTEEYIVADQDFPTLAAKRKVTLVKIDPQFYRPAEVDLLMGDSRPAREELGWSPKTTFDELVKKMVDHDIRQLARNGQR